MGLIIHSSPRTSTSWTRCSRFRPDWAIQVAMFKDIHRQSPWNRTINLEATQCQMLPSIAMVVAHRPPRTHHLTSQSQLNMALKSSKIPRLMQDSSLKCTITLSYKPISRRNMSQCSSIHRNRRITSLFGSSNNWRQNKRSNKIMLVSKDWSHLPTH